MKTGMGIKRDARMVNITGARMGAKKREAVRILRKGQLCYVVDVIVYNADQRSQATPRPRRQGRRATLVKV
jgi:hypothetical protein